MDTAKSISNAGYSVLKKKAGLHNRGFMTTRDTWDIEEFEELTEELTMSNLDFIQNQDKG